MHLIAHVYVLTIGLRAVFFLKKKFVSWYVSEMLKCPSRWSLRVAPFNMQNFQAPSVQYDAVFPQPGQMPARRASLNYQNLMISPYCAMGSTLNS